MLDERRSPFRPAVVVVAILALAVVMFALGRTTADRDGSASSVRDGVPVGYRHDRDAAIDAAMMDGSVYARAQLLDQEPRRAALRAIGTPEWAERADAAIGRLDLAPLDAGSGQSYVAAAIGAKALSYSPARAVVRGWFFQALGGSGRLRAVGSLVTQDITLAWDGDWRVAGIRDASEQAVPEMRQRRSGAGAVARLMKGLDAPTYGQP